MKIRKKKIRCGKIDHVSFCLYDNFLHFLDQHQYEVLHFDTMKIYIECITALKSILL